MRRGLAYETQRLELDLRQLSANPFLQAGAEVLDRSTVASALKTFCSAKDLVACAAFDSDGDLLGDLSGKNEDAPGARLSAAERKAAKLAAKGEGAAVELRKTTLVGLWLIGGDADDFGYLKLERRLGDAFASDLAKSYGAPLGVTSGGQLVLASESGARHEELAKLTPLPVEGELGVVAFDAPASAGAVEAWPVSPLELGLAFAALLLGLGFAFRFVLRRQKAAAARHLIRQLDAQAARHEEALGKAQGSTHEVERKLGRVADLLTIDEGAFRLFRAKVRRLGQLCAAELTRIEPGVQRQESFEPLAQILRYTHTIKSNARLFNLNRVHHAAKDAEDYLAELMRADAVSEAARAQLAELLGYVSAEVETYHDLRERLLGDARRSEQVGQQQALRLTWLTSLIGRIFTSLKNPTNGPAALSALYAEYQNAVASVGKEDLADYVQRYDRMLQEMGQKAGKQLAPLTLTGNLRFLAHDKMELLNDVFLHCLRNALDHGLETPLKRQAFGKPAAGKIQIDCNQMGGLAAIVIRDDGKGIDPEELRVKAVERGHLVAAAARTLSEEQLLDLVFQTGFSTSPVVTEISGRGVGMDVAKETMRQLGGDARVQTLKGHGTEVHLHFPLVESRFTSRLSLFNIHAELRTILAALAPLCADTHAELDAAPEMRRRALALLDRFLFGEAMKELLVALNTYAPKPARLVLSVAHADVGGACSLETYALKIAVSDEAGRPLPDLMTKAGLGPRGRLEGLLLDCGLYLPEPAAGGRCEIHVPAGTSDMLPEERFAVLALVRDPDAVSRLIAEQCEEHFGDLNCVVYRKDRLEQYLAEATEDAIVILDDAALADPALLRRLSGAPEANVVLVVPEMGAVTLRAVFQLSQDPLIIEGMLDGAAVTQALEFSLQRYVMRLKANDNTVKFGTFEMAG